MGRPPLGRLLFAGGSAAESVVAKFKSTAKTTLLNTIGWIRGIRIGLSPAMGNDSHAKERRLSQLDLRMK